MERKTSLQVWLALLLLGVVSSATFCPDGRKCEGTDTCCFSADGTSACCPVAAAVKAVICPDKKSECPEDTTCCQLPDETWGCCPMPKAVCCEDKRHCCPEGNQCDLSHSRCKSSLGYVAMREKIPARRIPAGVSTVTVACPGGKSSCPDGTTCCLLSSGEFGCCPYPEAVCCSDQLHCCPANTTCDVEHARCRLRGEGEEKVFPIAKLSARPNHVVCPDHESTCPDQTTCCQMNNGSYGCCPMPLATCCSDHLHCCPEGYSCDLVHSKCVSPPTATSLTPISYTPAKVKGTVVPCNDTVACADDNTCCMNTLGRWACCPLPQAVCCKDHLHCCPGGTVCNLVQSRCDDPRGQAPSLPWLTKQPVFSLVAGGEVAAVTSRDEKCDGQTMCPGGTTCCRKGSGDWACCPLVRAVCCDDQEHCCPHGYRCNLAQQSCDRPGFGSLPWLRKTPALPLVARGPAQLARDQPGSVACDSHTTCPQETTCCFMKRSASWGCCPLPKAVCCADQEHCCPNGYTCNAHAGSCSRPHAAGLLELPWVSKISARRHGAQQQGMLGDVKCDNSSSCATGTTCCKLESGGWGCCPLVKAVCCDDHEHCCPQGYTCNMQSGTCDKKLQRATLQSTLVRSVLRKSVEEEEEEEGVPCDAAGAFRCSKRETCCRSTATEWACCPSAQAVCCADSQHCCPSGSSCDGLGAGCTPHRRPGAPWDRDADRGPPGH